MRFLVLLAVVSLGLRAETVAAAISIDGYADATNDRFSNSTDFILEGFDLSGVGQNGSTWATAISRNVIIGAYHARPANGSSVRFYESNDPTVAPVARTVVSGVKVPNTDIFLATLDNPLPQKITHFSFATQPLNGSATANAPHPVADAGIYQDVEVFMFGRSPFDENADPNDSRTSFNDQAVGKNVITGYAENVPFLGNNDNDALIFDRDPQADPEWISFEARYAGGDSGGPTFALVNGELVLLGTNAFIYDGGDFGTGKLGSGINYLGNQRDFIANYIALNAVPEPSSLMFTAWLGILLSARRSRRSSPL